MCAFLIRLTSGYRDFLPVVAAGNDADVAGLREKAIEEFKAHTRQYARTQLIWIKAKLIPQCRQPGSIIPIYVLDASDPTKWAADVLNPAISVAKGTLSRYPTDESIHVQRTITFAIINIFPG